MEIKEPKLIAEGMDEAAIFKWMEEKLSASRLLQSAIARREALKQELLEVEQKIEVFTSAAAVAVIPQG